MEGIEIMNDRKNLVLVTVDSLRSDFVSCYGKADRDLTPNMDQLAQEGKIFRNAIAQGSYTRASVPSFFTSTYPWKLRSGGDISDRASLATILKENGYETAFFHSNPFLSRANGYGRGFDVFDDSLLPWNLNLSQKRTRQLGRFFRVLRKKPYLPAEKLVDKSINWLSSAGSPYFLWLHLMDPHGPYQKPDSGYLKKFRAEKLWQKAVNHPGRISEAEKEKLLEAYRSEVTYADRHIGRLLSAVNDRNEETVVALTADHGEEFGEHGDYSHNPKPYEELIRVPFLMDVSGRGGDEVEAQLALLELLPSLLDLAGVERGNYEFDGVSFAPLFGDENWEGRDQVICQPGDHLLCLRTERWKYVVGNGERRLYDLKNDPGETEDVLEENGGLGDKFDRILAEKESEYGVSEKFQEENLGVDEDEETKQRLEDLGYL